jgi:putative ABC transport system permease protein
MLKTIPLFNLLLAFLPAFFTIVILYKWSLGSKRALYAIFRMLVQLLTIGYCLTYIFNSDTPAFVLIILSIMILSSSWIALDSLKHKKLKLYKETLISIAIGGGFALVIVTQFVLTIQPWYKAQTMIPLAGMIFANCMNSISLASERFFAERERNIPYLESRNLAFKASLIPVTNSLFAVGLVSIPGMMTGQILSGISPLIATRYQIVVMCMVFGSAGVSTAIFLTLCKGKFPVTKNVCD